MKDVKEKRRRLAGQSSEAVYLQSSGCREPLLGKLEQRAITHTM